MMKPIAAEEQRDPDDQAEQTRSARHVRDVQAVASAVAVTHVFRVPFASVFPASSLAASASSFVPLGSADHSRGRIDPSARRSGLPSPERVNAA